MATAIKAIPTLKGKEAREFLRHAEEAERNYKGTNNRDDTGTTIPFARWLMPY